MSNLSKPYGYYGGVTNNNHYIPPPSAPYIPQPATVPFTKDMLTVVQSYLSSQSLRDFLSDNAGSIVFRKLITDYPVMSSFRAHEFEMKTQDNPSDTLTYDTLSSTVNLLLLDGGSF